MSRTIRMNLEVDGKKGQASIKHISKDINDLGKSSERVASNTSKSFDKVNKSISSVSGVAKTLNDTLLTVGKNASTTANQASKSMENYNKSIQQAAKSLDSLNKTRIRDEKGRFVASTATTVAQGVSAAQLGGVAQVAGAAASVGAVKGITTSVEQASKAAQTAQNSMKVYFDSLISGSKVVGSALQRNISESVGFINTALGKQMLAQMTANIGRFQEQMEKAPKPFLNSIKGVMSSAVSIVSGALGSIGRGFIDLYKFVKAHWLGIGAIITTVVLGIKKVITSSFDIAKLEQAREAFYNLSGSRGINADKLINDLKKVSKQTVATSDLISAAGRAMMLGVPAQNLSSLMEIAMATSKLTGQTVTEAFNDITLAVGRQSKMILDNLGIIVSVEQANEEYARSLNKTAEQLTDVDKKQAFMNATLKAGTKLINDIGMGSTTAADQFTQMAAAMTKVNEALKKVVSDSLPLVARLLGIITKMTAGWAILASKVTFGDLSKDLETFANTLADAAYALDDLVDAKRASQIESLNSAMEKHNKIMSETTKISPPGTFDVITDEELIGAGLKKPPVDKETANKILEMQNQVSAELIRLKKGEMKYELELLRQKYVEYKKSGEDIKGLEEWYARSKTEIIAKHHQERWKKILDITQDAINKLKAKYEAEQDLATETMKITGELTRDWKMQKAAEIAAEENKYRRLIELYGETLVGYENHMANMNAITEKYAAKHMEEKGSFWDNWIYGKDEALKAVESMNAAWQTVGAGFQEQVADQVVSGMSQMIDALYEGTLSWQGFAIGVQKASIDILKWMLEITAKAYLMNTMKDMFGAGEGAAATTGAETAAITAKTAAITAQHAAEIAGLTAETTAETAAATTRLGFIASETAAVSAMTTAYIALAAAKAAAGMGGGGGVVGGARYGGVFSNGHSMRGYAQGGIATGSQSGYPVMLHGTEAVLPLTRKGGKLGVQAEGAQPNINVQPAEVAIFVDPSMWEQFMTSPRGKKAQLVNMRSDPYAFSNAMRGR